MKSDSERLTEYINYLTVEKALARNTILAYQRDLQLLQEYLDFSGNSLSALSMEVMSDFVAWLRGQNSNHPAKAESSISRIVVTIRNFFQFDAKEHGTTNPIQDFHPPKIPKRLPKSLTVDEVERLIRACDRPGVLISFRDIALIEVLYATGGRISEIVGITLQDVSGIEGNDEEQTVAIKLRGKGGKERVVPLGKYAQHAVSQYLIRLRPSLMTAKRNDALFLNLRGARLSRQSAWQIVVEASERAMIEREVSPHSLRHSFATHLLDGGADIRVVQELLGHASVTTTQIYTLVTIDKLRESYSLAHPRAR
ncbi:MAG: site-specific tyrosine recombinase [Actinomycetes bacterium]